MEKSWTRQNIFGKELWSGFHTPQSKNGFSGVMSATLFFGDPPDGSKE
jgi:hypothetical protein